MEKIFGTIMSEGLGMGVVFKPGISKTEIKFSLCKDKNEEKKKISQALALAISEQEALIAEHKDKNKDTKDILTAYLFMLKDPDLKTQLFSSIDEIGCSATWAVKQVFDAMILTLCSVDDSYIKSRGEDLMNVMNRLTDILTGQHKDFSPKMPPKTVVLSRNISPSQFASFDLEKVVGIITCEGSPASHTAIMSRAARIPAICCSKADFENIDQGDIAMIDANKGFIVINPDGLSKEGYIEDIEKDKTRQTEELHFKNKKGLTKDGVHIPVEANIGSLMDLPTALEQGAEGIGLVRTEFLFSGAMPPLAVQFDIYKKIVDMLPKKPVVFRLLDVGGDKLGNFIEYDEQNPFLGYRGIRLLLSHKEVIATQIEAMLMASAYGDITILLPMVSSINEIRSVKKIITKLKKELAQKKIPFDDKIKIGAMIEVPSAAIMANEIAAEVDLLSIGTNDLTQYTLAVDRGNSLVSNLYHHHHPAVMRLIEMTAQAGKSHGIDVCVCGEMASQAKLAGTLIALGVTKLSVSPGMICNVKSGLNSTSMEESKILLNKLKKCKTANEVAGLLLRN